MAAIPNITAFASKNRYEYIHMKSHVDVLTNSGPSATITHGLGYVPFFRLFVRYPGRSFFQPVFFGPVEPDAYFDYQTFINVLDTTKMEIGILNNTGNPDSVVPVYYRIYAEPQA